MNWSECYSVKDEKSIYVRMRTLISLSWFVHNGESENVWYESKQLWLVVAGLYVKFQYISFDAISLKSNVIWVGSRTK